MPTSRLPPRKSVVPPGLPAQSDGAPSAWGRYLALSDQHRIPETTRRWYVVRAQAFVTGMRPQRLGALTAAEIKAFFPRYAWGPRLTDWQYRQTVEAVQRLLVQLGGCRAAQEVEWELLIEAGQALPADQPTRMGTVIDGIRRDSHATAGHQPTRNSQRCRG